MITKKDKNALRLKRHMHVRHRIVGTSERPRLNVFRSSKNIYAQLIDDTKGVTLVSSSSIDKAFDLEKGSDVAAAKRVGEIIGKRAAEKGIDRVVFDRSGYIYHGRVEAVAEGAREAGLKF
ncbi:50S ribosomal protein L18 [Sporolactobacillus sp. Y61]|jgi:large subunit ribosomal protein L18|uniref:Large ribosomal subunit protein uL18 n=1 Tax=Sporolactobacillus sp. Y61 TaxID=3160863 RepID=A0AAU8IHV0_9BACL|nr:50S ribosomal protein L18 [Sporolactobacillus sp. THM19-2]RYL89393.1 50S ribosomal protein L18 [Sporolactobacillus sp. THM19-2]